MTINWFTFFAQIVNFLIVLLLLKRFLYRPILSVMAEREAQITARFKEAEELAEQARAEGAYCRSEREQMEDQRDAFLSEATVTAERRRLSMIDEARAEVEEMQQGWYAAVEHEKQRFLQEVRTRMGETIYNVAHDALADLADVDLEQAIVAAFLRKMDERFSDETPSRHSEPDTNGVTIVRSTFDLSPNMQDQIRETLSNATTYGATVAESEGASAISFAKSPDLICGIEAQFRNRRVSWNIRDYLDSYAEQLNATLTSEMNAQRRPVDSVEQDAAAWGILPG